MMLQVHRPIFWEDEQGQCTTIDTFFAINRIALTWEFGPVDCACKCLITTNSHSLGPSPGGRRVIHHFRAALITDL